MGNGSSGRELYRLSKSDEPDSHIHRAIQYQLGPFRIDYRNAVLLDPAYPVGVTIFQLQPADALLTEP
jgi:hypothetical protein